MVIKCDVKLINFEDVKMDPPNFLSLKENVSVHDIAENAKFSVRDISKRFVYFKYWKDSGCQYYKK